MTMRAFWLAAGLTVSCAVWGATLTVDDDGRAGFQSIQAAIDAASPGDLVSVAPGLYQENIVMRSGVSVVGAGSDNTLIDGGHSGSVAVLVDCDSSTRLEGFTLTGGEAEDGGGIFVEGGAPIISRNHIIGNSAVESSSSGRSGVGGGVFIRGGAALLRRNRITNNTADGIGGGVMARNSEARVEANTISFNSAVDYGGGIALNGPTTPIISNNLIVGNTAEGDSGGVDVYYSSAILINNTLADNQSFVGGGSLVIAMLGQTPSLINNIFFRNTAGRSGGGVELWVSETGAVELFNNHFSRIRRPSARDSGSVTWAVVRSPLTLLCARMRRRC